MNKNDWRNRVAGHRERLRQKFLDHGLEKLTDEEVVELLLTLATPRRDCKQIAREALRCFDGLAGVLEASMVQLQQVPGIGPKNALGLKLVHEVARKFLQERLKGREFISSSKEVYEYLLHSLRDLKKEVFKVIFLNGRNEVIQVEKTAAFEYAQRAAREEGLFVGISSGASLAAVGQLLEKAEASIRVLTFNYDTGERYLSVNDLF